MGSGSVIGPVGRGVGERWGQGKKGRGTGGSTRRDEEGREEDMRKERHTTITRQHVSPLGCMPASHICTSTPLRPSPVPALHPSSGSHHTYPVAPAVDTPLMDSIKSPVCTPATAAGLGLATPTTCTDTRSVGKQAGRQAGSEAEIHSADTCNPHSFSFSESA